MKLRLAWRVRAEFLAMLLLGAALWFVNYPYAGMYEHDGRVYTLMALHSLAPDAYARDPFFQFGSQDRFTLFTPIYAGLGRFFGLDEAARLLVAFGGVLWVGGVALIARGLLPDGRWRVLAVLLFIFLDLNYSPNGGTFRLSEAFPTARALAFPLAALGIGLAIHQRWLAASVLSLLAVVIHPLIGVWSVALLVAARVSDPRLLRLLVAGIALLAALAIAGLPAVQPMDAAWEEIIRSSSIDVFSGGFGVLRLNDTLLWLAVLLWAGRLAPVDHRRWYSLAALVGASGFLASQLVAYAYPAVLLVQAQMWRAMWVALLFGVMALAQVVAFAWTSRDRMTWAVGALLLVVASGWSGAVALLAWLVHVGSPSIRQPCVGAIDRMRPYLLWIGAGIVVMLLPGYLIDLTILGEGVVAPYRTGIAPLDGLLLAGGFGVGAALWAVFYSGRLGIMLLAGSAIGCLYAAFHWDQRTLGYRAWESNRATLAPAFSAAGFVPGDVVFWSGASPQRVWHDLGTANYASADQAIGGVFSREKTFDLLRRRQHLAVAFAAEDWPLGAAQKSVLLNQYRRQSGLSLDERGNLHASFASANVSGAGLRIACEDMSLDWIVSNKPFVGAELPGIDVTDAFTGERFNLYSCKAFRARLKPAKSLSRGACEPGEMSC